MKKITSALRAKKNLGKCNLKIEAKKTQITFEGSPKLNYFWSKNSKY